jgi:PrcB C-terminal
MRRSFAAVRACAALAAAALLGAEGRCGADREVPVEVVRAAAQCGGEGTGVTVRRLGSDQELRGEARLDDEIRGSARRRLEGPAPDFEREAVLLVSMGQQPSAGYAVELARPVALVKGEVAGLQVALRRPAPGAMTAQVVTAPCLVVKLPREGLAEVKVADADGKVLGAVKLR